MISVYADTQAVTRWAWLEVLDRPPEWRKVVNIPNVTISEHAQRTRCDLAVAEPTNSAYPIQLSYLGFT